MPASVCKCIGVAECVWMNASVCEYVCVRARVCGKGFFWEGRHEDGFC